MSPDKSDTGSSPFSHRFFVGVFFGVAVGFCVGFVLTARQKIAETEPPLSGLIELEGEKQFVEFITSDGLVLVDFHAEWCGPCKRLKPSIHEIAKEYAGRITVVTVNVDENRETARLFGVKSLPDVRFYKGGVLQKAVMGAEQKAVYTDIIDHLLNTTAAPEGMDDE